MFFWIGLFATIASSIVAAAIASAKNHNPWLWAALSFFFPVIGVVVIASLPANKRTVDEDECPACHSVSVTLLQGAGRCESCGHAWVAERVEF